MKSNAFQIFKYSVFGLHFIQALVRYLKSGGHYNYERNLKTTVFNRCQITYWWSLSFHTIHRFIQINVTEADAITVILKCQYFCLWQDQKKKDLQAILIKSSSTIEASLRHTYNPLTTKLSNHVLKKTVHYVTCRFVTRVRLKHCCRTSLYKRTQRVIVHQGFSV